MQMVEGSFVTSKSSRCRVGKELRYTMKVKRNMDELREVVLSDMSAIIAIQGTQQRSVARHSINC